jgi:hypothetical protein
MKRLTCDCFIEMQKQLVEENTIDGHEPLITDYSNGRSVLQTIRWSKRQKRYAKISCGNYIRKSWKYCPICGKPLREAKENEFSMFVGG